MHDSNEEVAPWITMKIRFTPKAIEISFALITTIVWIMQSSFVGNIGPVWIVSIKRMGSFLQTYY
jgi:hypothetical protein